MKTIIIARVSTKGYLNTTLSATLHYEEGNKNCWRPFAKLIKKSKG